MSHHLPPNPVDLKRAAHLVETYEKDDDYQIRAWAFDQAPRALQMLSTNGGDEDWLFYIPSKAARDESAYYWIENLDSMSRPQVIEMPEGARVVIVAHA